MNYKKDNGGEKMENDIIYTTIKSMEWKGNGKKFIELSIKKGEDGVEFLNIAKGFYAPSDNSEGEGKRIYSRSIGFKYDKAMVNWIIEALKSFI
jgi:hypothetical protein